MDAVIEREDEVGRMCRGLEIVLALCIAAAGVADAAGADMEGDRGS